MSDTEHSCGRSLPNLLELSADLNHLLQGSVLSDFSLCINGTDIVCCHKDILKYRSRWFRVHIEQAETRGVSQIAITENRHTLEAVLFYIYSGNLRHLESLDISLLDLYQAAKTYGLLSLEVTLTRIVKEKKIHETTNTLSFVWKIKVEDYSSLTAEYSALDSFSLCGTDKWKLQMKPMLQTDDAEPRLGIYVTRQMGETRDTLNTVVFLICIIDSNGAQRCAFSTQNTFMEDGEYLVVKFLTYSELTKSAESLLPGGVLKLSCQLSISAKVGYLEKFRIESPYRKYVSNELIELSDAMYRLFKFGRCQDIKFELSSSHTVRIHSYIFVVRTRVPQNFIQKLGIQARLGNIGWSSFVCFLYTGQPRFLDDHGRDVFCALSTTVFTDAKRKYSSYLSKNLTLENAFETLCDAVKCKDDHLQASAADFLAKKSNTITDRREWIRIASDKMSSIMVFLPHLHTYNIQN